MTIEKNTDYFGEGSLDKSIQMWIDKKKIESLTQQVESLTQKLKQQELKLIWTRTESARTKS